MTKHMPKMVIDHRVVWVWHKQGGVSVRGALNNMGHDIFAPGGLMSWQINSGGGYVIHGKCRWKCDWGLCFDRVSSNCWVSGVVSEGSLSTWSGLQAHRHTDPQNLYEYPTSLRSENPVHSKADDLAQMARFVTTNSISIFVAILFHT